MTTSKTDKHQKEWFESWFESKLYDLMYAHRDEVEAEGFLSHLLTYLCPEPDAFFLDLACGTGRHARYVHSQGYNVTGIDLSQRKIAKASKFAQPGLEFFIQDMRKPFRRKYFDYVLNLFTSFGYFDREEDNAKVIRSVRSSLKKGGTLIIDFLNAEYTRKNLVEKEEKVFEDWQVNIQRQISSNRLIKQMHWSNGTVKREYEEKVTLFSHSDFEDLMTSNGFEIQDTFGTYNLERFDIQNSERLILVCTC